MKQRAKKIEWNPPVFRRQVRQNRLVDLFLAERSLVPSKVKAPQPNQTSMTTRPTAHDRPSKKGVSSGSSLFSSLLPWPPERGRSAAIVFGRESRERTAPMSKNDDYRANADKCQRMAEIARSNSEKRHWLDVARHWLSLIRPETEMKARADDSRQT
jgi:hypothetical protein